MKGETAILGSPGGDEVPMSGVLVGLAGGGTGEVSTSGVCVGGMVVGGDVVPTSGVMVGLPSACVAGTEPGEGISAGFVSEGKAASEVVDNRVPASSVDVEVALAG